MKPALITLFFVFLIFFGYQISIAVKEKPNTTLGLGEARSQVTDNSVEPGPLVPPMDMAVPEIFETASFGLG